MYNLESKETTANQNKGKTMFAVVCFTFFMYKTSKCES